MPSIICCSLYRSKHLGNLRCRPFTAACWNGWFCWHVRQIDQPQPVPSPISMLVLDFCTSIICSSFFFSIIHANTLIERVVVWLCLCLSCISILWPNTLIFSRCAVCLLSAFTTSYYWSLTCDLGSISDPWLLRSITLHIYFVRYRWPILGIISYVTSLKQLDLSLSTGVSPFSVLIRHYRIS